mmetsp:Transcript_13727/g.22884  ORF Transcript_13727/g.22884 Transcript_13727/m.22884 type:complete len:313 (-) Transcript_13727:325-1263(-)|eukprot:CAMPEP_0174969844 /NCGR_PEP_ID=MMETSP0004_2-20121128/9009_1 /TAXON_ID=420556 /ORGANISM="Ochromonas sp., Strain CCMP1393" /LENGTH=312 /DNA_ID=CAMNT_0016219421 /DNA_START=36 /DNA_END=974 /DNA_ORIENTATION=+
MYPNNNLYVKTSDQAVLLIIDPQIDFHEPGGSLAVPGSEIQAGRIAKFIEKHKMDIGEIFITLDSHHKKHIAHQAFWSDMENDVAGKGKKPELFSQIKNEDLVKGKWFPRDCSLQEYCLKYTNRLEKAGRFTLTIWPDHCLIGSDGHAIHEEIQKAVREWDIFHYTKTVKHIHKGMNCLTEMYSAIQAEVPIPSDPNTTKNTELLQELEKSGRLFVCGQALSHCVNFTVRDIVKHFKENNVTTDRIFILKDGAAPVATYEADGEQFLKDMEAEGCTITTLDEAFNGWKGASGPAKLRSAVEDIAATHIEDVG